MRLMTGWTTSFLILAVLAIPAAAAQPLVIAAVVSQTGAHADLAQDYARALQLWHEEVNEAGGLLGQRVELRLLDDGSEALRAGALYRQLVLEKPDGLIGPYGTAATMLAAAEAETAQRVMINGAGWSGAVHKRSPRFVFQSAVPYKAYGAGVLRVAKDAGASTALILARDDPAAVEMGAGALDSALKLGIAARPVESYSGSQDDFSALVTKAKQAKIDAWIAFGQVRDAAEMVKTFKRLGYAPRIFFASAASDPKLIPRLGQDAERSLGATAYDRRFRTAGNAQFVQAFSKRWGRAPTAAGAEGYAAATVLAEGFRHAGTRDQSKLRASLASLVTQTVLGEFRADPSTGEQVATSPALTQVLKGRPELVWPASLRTAEAVLPYPQWNQREYMK
jgi:branched-chain amino acid transport system substrate-binding protein